MADGIIQELTIALGLDIKDLASGARQVTGTLEQMSRDASGAVQALAASVTGSAGQATASTAETAAALTQAGNAGQKAAQQIGKGFGSLPSVFDGLRSKILGVVGSLAAAFVGAKTFDDYLQQADGLGQLSRKTGIAVDELDAWSKANEAAGGSAQALQATLENFYKKTGRPATEFFKLGQKIEGMSQLQARRFLEAQGVALDAVPVFLKGQKAADQLVAKYRRTAFTAYDAKLARDYKNAWTDFKIAASDVAGVFIRAAMPALTAVGRALERFATIIRENIPLVVSLGGVLTVAFGAKAIANIKSMIAAVRAFGITLNASIWPIAAIAAGIAAIALAVEDLWTFATGGDSALESLLTSMGVGRDTIEQIRAAVQAVFGVWSKLWDALKPVVGGIVSGAFKVIAGVLLGIAGLITGLVSGIAWVVSSIDDWAQALYDLLPGFDEIGAWFAKIGDLASNLGTTIKNALSGVLGDLVSIFSEWFGAFISTFIDPIKNAAKGVFKGIASFFGFGKGDNSPPPAAQAGVLREQAAQGARVQNVSTSFVQTNNITGATDPQATAAAVSSRTAGAARSMSGAVQAMSGVRFK